MVEMIREKSRNLGKKEESDGFLTTCPNVKVLPLLRFNLMISVATKMLYQEIMESSLWLGKIL